MPLASSRFAPLPLVAGVLLASCANSGDYPSLAPRPAELGEPAAKPEPPPAAPAAADPALAARIERLRGQAQSGDEAFRKALATAAAAVKRAGAPQTDSWIGAQEAVSRLEAARAPTIESVSELDVMARTQSESGTGSDSDRAAVAGASEEVTALADHQKAEIDRLNAALPSP